MKYLLIVFFLFYFIQGWTKPEWQIYVPDQPVDISGVMASPIKPLIIVDIDGVETIEALDLMTFTGQILPVNARITALAFTQRPFTEVVFSLDQPFMEYKAGEAIKCHAGSCVAMIDPQSDLGAPAGVQLNALSWVAESDFNDTLALISLDQDITVNGSFYRRQDVLAVTFDSQMNNPVISNIFTNGDSINLRRQNEIIAYDYAANLSGQYESFVAAHGFSDTNNDYVGPNVVKERFNQAIGGVGSALLYDEITAITAYSASNSGWAEWLFSATSFSEDDGQVDIALQRIDGKDQYQEYTVSQIGGTAVEGVDFEILTPILAWSNQASGVKNTVINLLDNNILDGDKTLVLQITPNSFFALVHPQENLIAVSINEDDASDLIFKDGFE